MFALIATESSMIVHRVGKVGVVEYKVIVPVFAGVCNLFINQSILVIIIDLQLLK